MSEIIALNKEVTELKDKIVARMTARPPQHRLQWLSESPSITETTELIYTSAAVILEILGYNSNHEKQYPPWKRQLEPNITVAQREVSQSTEAQRGAMKPPIPKRYTKVSIPKALETFKQRLQALAYLLRRYTKDNEARQINMVFATQTEHMGKGGST